MYLKNKTILLATLFIFLGACASQPGGFFDFSSHDRKEYRQAREAYNNADYQKAVQELSAYIYKTKNVRRREERAYRLLGKSYEQLGRPGKALEVYLEALEYHPGSVELLLCAADLYQSTGLLDRSQELYERALAKEEDNTQALAGLAHNYYLIGFDSRAREIYDHFFALTPTAAPIYRARYAQTFLHQRQYEQAFIHITRALQEDQENAAFWLLSARALHGLKRYPDALAHLDAALWIAPKDEELLSTKAFWLYEDKQYDAAYQTAAQILQSSPKNSLALFVQGICLYRQGKVKKAKAQLTRVAAEDPTSFVGKVAQKILQEYSKKSR